MSAEEFRAILTPIRNQWLPLIETEPHAEAREQMFRAALGDAFLAGQRDEIDHRARKAKEAK